MEQIIEERQEITYTENEEDIINDEMSEIALNIQIKDKKGISPIYPDQIQEAQQILDKFYNNPKLILISILKKTQSGKTGVNIGLLYLIFKYKQIIIPPSNVFVITGLSDIMWVEQMKERFPDKLGTNIFHRGQLKKFIEAIKNLKNCIILMDEIQIGSSIDQLLSKSFKELGFDKIENLLEKNIKLIHFTATPNGTIYDQKKWGEYAQSILFEPNPEKYFGAKKMLENNQIKQFQPLFINEHIIFQENSAPKKNIKKHCEQDILINLQELKDTIKKYFNSPKYHIIRIPNGKNNFNLFTQIFNQQEYDYIYYTSEQKNEILDINDILKDEPKKDTFIFIKEKIRCSKTFDIKKYIGICYERYVSKVDDSVIIQGLLGRLCGYIDNKDIICYTNIESIKKYEKLWDQQFIQHTNVKWNSATTSTKHGYNYSIRPSVNSQINLDKNKENRIEKQDVHQLQSFYYVGYYQLTKMQRQQLLQSLEKQQINGQELKILKCIESTIINSEEFKQFKFINQIENNICLTSKKEIKSKNNNQLIIEIPKTKRQQAYYVEDIDDINNKDSLQNAYKTYGAINQKSNLRYSFCQNRNNTQTCIAFFKYREPQLPKNK